MRDISAKTNTLRTATAQATLQAGTFVLEKLRSGDLPKGDPLPVAKVAAIQAAKSTSQIIPYCHPVPVDFVSVDFKLLEDRILITVTVKAIYKTGVEMEALTAASVAALTIYDMLKALDKTMEILSIQLLEKKGGKSDWRSYDAAALKVAVLVMSDTVAAGTVKDKAGLCVVERMETLGLQLADYRVIPDDGEKIADSIKEFADEMAVDLIVTTGGTGLGPRDITPDVLTKLFDKEIPGIVEVARAYGQERMPLAMLSRAKAGLRGKTLIIALPGSRGAVVEYLDALFPAVLHSFHVLSGGGHGK
ncbi:MAG: bifunctional molybdenum cofactor biosynthesis protein MoaC/MoaB [Candidatus Obscuribacterales bacterium]|nr:bifunctional molybdenum cofactor biosynthesis protein MoaC/MoaB [Candidatus Obscuribacterales bacterium]